MCVKRATTFFFASALSFSLSRCANISTTCCLSPSSCVHHLKLTLSVDPFCWSRTRTMIEFNMQRNDSASTSDMLTIILQLNFSLDISGRLRYVLFELFQIKLGRSNKKNMMTCAFLSEYFFSSKKQLAKHNKRNCTTKKEEKETENQNIRVLKKYSFAKNQRGSCFSK